MQIFNTPPGTATKVVSEHELAAVTKAGWRLVCIVTTQEAIHLSEEIEPPPPQPGYNNYVQPTRSKGRTELGTVSKFLVELDKESVLHELRGALELQRVATDHAELENRKTKEDLQILNQMLANKTSEIERRSSEYAMLTETLRVGQGFRRKLEEDIAKIREAIGSSKMKEILGG